MAKAMRPYDARDIKTEAGQLLSLCVDSRLEGSGCKRSEWGRFDFRPLKLWIELLQSYEGCPSSFFRTSCAHKAGIQ